MAGIVLTPEMGMPNKTSVMLLRLEFSVPSVESNMFFYLNIHSRHLDTHPIQLVQN